MELGVTGEGTNKILKCILEVEPMGSADGLDVEHEGKEERNQGWLLSL